MPERPGLLPYVFVESVDETLEKVVARGGEVLAPPYPEGDVPGIDEARFSARAEEAKRGCIISRALGGVGQINLTAKLIGDARGAPSRQSS